MPKNRNVDTPKQGKDVTSKFLASMFKNKSFAVYGVDLPKITECLPTEFPAVEANDKLSDMVFRLEDKSLLIVDYESSPKTRNMHKYLSYVSRVAQYYDPNARGINIRMLVIYTCDFSKSYGNYDMGSVVMNIEQAFVTSIDGRKKLREIQDKVSRKESLTDEEQMLAIILPLTIKGKPGKIHMIDNVLELASQIKQYDRKVAAFIVSGMITAAGNFITNEQAERAKEVIQMTKLDELYEKDKKKAVKEAVEDTEKRVRVEEKKKHATVTVDRLLRIGTLTNEQIADVVGVTLEFVLERAGQKTA